MSKIYPTWTARIPPEVKEYLQVYKSYSAGFCLCEYYKFLKSQELAEKKKELEKARRYVLQLEQDVLQIEQKNNEKQIKKLEIVKNKVMSSYNPEFYIGQIIDGVKITKKLLKDWEGD